jgi:hypothetical protein
VTSGIFTQDFTISYSADAGNDVLLVAIPEPSCALLLIGAVGVLGLRRSRRRRSSSPFAGKERCQGATLRREMRDAHFALG